MVSMRIGKYVGMYIALMDYVVAAGLRPRQH